MDSISNNKVGTELAQQVAKELRNYPLMDNHREYCGVGLFWHKGLKKYLYVRVFDGCADETLIEFDTEQEFIEWLASQSDETLQGLDEENPFYRDNQRLTLARLNEFVSKKKS